MLNLTLRRYLTCRLSHRCEHGEPLMVEDLVAFGRICDHVTLDNGAHDLSRRVQTHRRITF